MKELTVDSNEEEARNSFNNASTAVEGLINVGLGFTMRSFGMIYQLQ